MSAQIKFFTKNIIDLDNSSASIVVTDTVAYNNGQSYVNYVRNRNNYSLWATTQSTDAANTTLDIYFGDSRDLASIFLILHNLKSYSIKYFDGLAFQDFSTAINETTNTGSVTQHEFTKVTTYQIRIIITGTMIANDDKFIQQIICCDKLGVGQLETWPNIGNPEISLNKQTSKMTSGKIHTIETSGFYKASFNLKTWKPSNDLDILEKIFFKREGILVWPCGGDESQFSSKRIGYRREDIYLVRPTNEYQPEWSSNLYKSGLNIKMDLSEATN